MGRPLPDPGGRESGSAHMSVHPRDDLGRPLGPAHLADTDFINGDEPQRQRIPCRKRAVPGTVATPAGACMLLVRSLVRGP